MAGKGRANGEGSIYPFRNGFAAYVWVTTPAGERKRKYVYGPTREGVHDKWLKLHQAAKNGPVATSVPRLSEYLNYWLTKVIKPNRAPKTFINYELFTRLYINPTLGGRRLDKLSVRDVQKWINGIPSVCQCCVQGKDARRDEKRRRCCALSVRRCCKDAPSDRTVSHIRACLRTALNQAIRDELIGRNVAELVTLPTVRKRKRTAWTTEEARKFLESARDARDAMYAGYVLAVVLGLRKGEILGLTWGALDFDNGELAVSHQLQRAGGELLHRATKTAESDDTMPLPSIVVTALEKRRRDQLADRKEAEVAWQPTDLVFTTKYGRPIEPRNFNRSWDNRVARSDVRKITVHDGRRSCGTLLVDLDVHPRVIMRILRHAQFSMTMEIYSQASSAKTRDALKRLGESLDE
jgi:integrase